MSHPSELKIAAVNYLNMFPFFAFAEDVVLFETPREANAATARGDVQAACISAISGIRNSLTPVSPFMGVATRTTVESVFVEPVLETSQDEIFWNQFSDAVKTHRIAASGTTFKQKEHVIHLVSSGASEQSEWMFRTLCRNLGFEVQVHYSGDAKNVEAHSLHILGAQTTPFKSQSVARLYIGDPALLRKWITHPETPRWDLATLWQHASQGPAIFAIWYGNKTENSEVLGEKILNNLKKWQDAPEQLKLQTLLTFLENSRNSVHRQILVWKNEKKLWDYLSNLTFILDNDFQIAFDGYRKLANSY